MTIPFGELEIALNLHTYNLARCIEHTSYSPMLNIAEPVPPPASNSCNSYEFRNSMLRVLSCEGYLLDIHPTPGGIPGMGRNFFVSSLLVTVSEQRRFASSVLAAFKR